LRKAEANQAEDETSRYRTGSDAIAKAGSPDSAADRPDSAASTLPALNKPGLDKPGLSKQDANWDFGAASLSGNITD